VHVQTPIDNGAGSAAIYEVTFRPGATYVAQDLNRPLSKTTFTAQASDGPGPVTMPSTPSPSKSTSTPSVWSDPPSRRRRART
jgi:hypothetical protein